MCITFYLLFTFLPFPGKLWGKPTGQPVLLLHGLLDNCGAFDRFISLLIGDYYILAIDLPGHGLSSYFPAGQPIDLLHFVIAAKFVIDEIKWHRFSIIGHSLGGLIGIHFSSCFPAFVEKLIIIDAISHRPFIDEKHVLFSIRLWIEEFMTLDERLQKHHQPVYSYQEAFHKLTNRDSYVTAEAAKILTERSLKKTENGYVFRMDQRLKMNLFPALCTSVMTDALEHIRCRVLFIYSTERHEVYKDLFKEIYSIISTKPNFIVQVVHGNHEVHQNSPERIVKLIDEFFMKNSKL